MNRVVAVGAVVALTGLTATAASAAPSYINLSPTRVACRAAEAYADGDQPVYGHFVAMHVAASRPGVSARVHAAVFRLQGDVLTGRGPGSLAADIAVIYRICGRA